MKENLVSVVIPTYNREHTIVGAIESVLAQTYLAIQVVVVDDCSQDRTEEVIRNTFGNDDRVKYERLEQNSGACVARNRGVVISDGAYIAFLDSDDVFYPEKIALQMESLKNSGKDLSVSAFLRIMADGKKEHKPVFPGTPEEVYQRLLYLNFITTGTLLGKRECFENFPFDESLPRYQDWDLALRLSKAYPIEMLTDELMEQVHQEISITSSTGHKKTLDALKRILAKNEEGFARNQKASTQIHWLMGIHSMYVAGEKSFSDLWTGVVENGFNLKRFFIFLMMMVRLEKIFESHL